MIFFPCVFNVILLLFSLPGVDKVCSAPPVSGVGPQTQDTDGSGQEEAGVF